MTTHAQTGQILMRHVAPFAPVALALLMHSASPAGGSGSPNNPSTTAPAATPGFVQFCTSPHFPPNSSPTAIDETDCTIAGNGGAETWQNQAKNNFCATAPARAMTLAQLLSLQTKVEQDPSVPFGNPHNHPFTTKAGPATDRKPMQALGEGTEVTLEGFVLVARQEGGESVNCGKNVPNIPDDHDIHISIVESAGQEECSSVVAEMVPHHRPKSWTAKNLNAIAAQKLPVRILGQLLFDSSHSPCRNGSSISGDPKRSSLWEVHPVYEFDVCAQGSCSSGAGWVPLEEFVKP
jgi:hypothetical protein